MAPNGSARGEQGSEENHGEAEETGRGAGLDAAIEEHPEANDVEHQYTGRSERALVQAAG
jgi:hypothetical protein